MLIEREEVFSCSILIYVRFPPSFPPLLSRKKNCSQHRKRRLLPFFAAQRAEGALSRPKKLELSVNWDLRDVPEGVAFPRALGGGGGGGEEVCARRRSHLLRPQRPPSRVSASRVRSSASDTPVTATDSSKPRSTSCSTRGCPRLWAKKTLEGPTGLLRTPSPAGARLEALFCCCEAPSKKYLDSYVVSFQESYLYD